MRLWMLSKAVFQHAYNKVSHDFFLTKEMIGVKNKQWIYKVGGRPQGLILSLFVFVLFGGMTFYFYLQINRHGAFLFGFLLAILVLFLIFFSVFRGLFIKVLIAEDGFYHQTKPRNGKYYTYGQIKEAWRSEGKQFNGSQGYFCGFETWKGEIVKFSFFPFEEEGITYLIQRVKECHTSNYYTNPCNRQKYTINGKPHGKTTIAVALVFLLLFLVGTMPAILQAVPTGFGITGLFFTGVTLLSIIILCILLIIRYQCFKVQIEDTGFYFQSSPFNGKYYLYEDIKSYKIEKKVYHQHSTMDGTHSTLHYYYFIFTDRNGKSVKFQFQKPFFDHEVEILKERIEHVKKEKESYEQLKRQKS